MKHQEEMDKKFNEKPDSKPQEAPKVIEIEEDDYGYEEEEWPYEEEDDYLNDAEEED